jgi:hypothetical protein
MTHQKWANYQCQRHARIFKWTADDSPASSVKDPMAELDDYVSFGGKT